MASGENLKADDQIIEDMLPPRSNFPKFIVTFAMSVINYSRSAVLGFCNSNTNGRIRTIENREM